MTELLIEDFSKIGLHLNASKTKILTTDLFDYEFLEIGGNMVEILHGNSTHRFLGRHLPGILENRGDVEVSHRIQAAWMKYGQFSRILSNRKISVKLRLKLFDAIVSPTLLFGLSILPIRQSHLEKIDVVQNKMLRKIIGWVRLSTDNWETTMRRMSSRLNRALNHHPITSWSEKVRKAQWKYIVRLKSLPAFQWPAQASRWKIAEVNDDSCLYYCRRSPGGQLCRWEDNIAKFSKIYLGGNWYDVGMPRFLQSMSQFLTVG